MHVRIQLLNSSPSHVHTRTCTRAYTQRKKNKSPRYARIHSSAHTKALKSINIIRASEFSCFKVNFSNPYLPSPYLPQCAVTLLFPSSYRIYVYSFKNKHSSALWTKQGKNTFLHFLLQKICLCFSARVHGKTQAPSLLWGSIVSALRIKGLVLPGVITPWRLFLFTTFFKRRHSNKGGLIFIRKGLGPFSLFRRYRIATMWAAVDSRVARCIYAVSPGVLEFKQMIKRCKRGCWPESCTTLLRETTKRRSYPVYTLSDHFVRWACT